MAAMTLEVNMTTAVEQLLLPLIGQACWRKEVGSRKSLSLGFGRRIRYNAEREYGEWELGTYYNPWRFVMGTRILCGSHDAYDLIDDLNKTVKLLDIGRFRSLRQMSAFDVRLEFDSGVFTDILAATCDDDEAFHVFCPENKCIVFSPAKGWQVGPSRGPWAG